MNAQRYTIAIIPPHEIAERAMMLSRSLKSFDSCFVLDGETAHPHLTLYHANFTPVALARVIAVLETTVQGIAPFELRQLTYYPDQGIWVGVRFVADKCILDLHTSVIAVTRAYRTIEDNVAYKEQQVEIPSVEFKNIEYCGWAHSFTLYSPHLTLTRLQHPHAGILKHLTQPELSFRVDHIGVYETGNYGACTRRVADFWFTSGSSMGSPGN